MVHNSIETKPSSFGIACRSFVLRRWFEGAWGSFSGLRRIQYRVPNGDTCWLFDITYPGTDFYSLILTVYGMSCSIWDYSMWECMGVCTPVTCYWDAKLSGAFVRVWKDPSPVCEPVEFLLLNYRQLHTIKNISIGKL